MCMFEQRDYRDSWQSHSHRDEGEQETSGIMRRAFISIPYPFEGTRLFSFITADAASSGSDVSTDKSKMRYTRAKRLAKILQDVCSLYSGFNGVCEGTAKWTPQEGQVPRGFVGALDSIEEVDASYSRLNQAPLRIRRSRAYIRRRGTEHCWRGHVSTRSSV